jgi:hypothetical protein
MMTRSIQPALLGVVLLAAACSDTSSTEADATFPSGDVADSTDAETFDVVDADAPEPVDVAIDAASDVAPDTLDAANDDATEDADIDAAAALRALLDPAPCLDAVTPSAPLTRAATSLIGADRYSPLSVLLDSIEVGEALEGAAAAVALAESRRAGRAAAAESCGTDRDCVSASIAWTPDDIAAATAALADLVQGETLDLASAWVDDHEWPFGFANPEPAALVGALVELDAALQNEANGRAIDEIDLAALTDVLAPATDLSGRFDREAAALTLALLEAAGRDEAFRYDPLASTENSAVREAVAALDFDAYPYAAILVPGQGPTDADTEISELSIQRVDLALQRYNAGLAPIILTSGGHVHPDRTVFSEAIEMRRRLVDVHGLPPSAVAIDPYARHTTTNLRNAARVLFELGVPLDKPVLVTSDQFQTVYIAGGITQRSLDELGFVPWVQIEQLGRNDSCVVLTPDSFRLDSTDALDP